MEKDILNTGSESVELSNDKAVENIQNQTRYDVWHGRVDLVGKAGVQATEMIRTAGEHTGEAVGNLVRGTAMTLWGTLRGVAGWNAKRPPSTSDYKQSA